MQHDRWIYIKIHKGIPILKQAGNIENNRLCTHLAKNGYAPVQHTPALQKHEKRVIIFTLVLYAVDIKFTFRQDAEHFPSALEDLYIITKDWEGACFLGFTLKWDYINRTVEMPMPKYVITALYKLQKPIPLQYQDKHHQWNMSTYGAATQYVNPEDGSIPLTPEGIAMVRKM